MPSRPCSALVAVGLLAASVALGCAVPLSKLQRQEGQWGRVSAVIGGLCTFSTPCGVCLQTRIAPTKSTPLTVLPLLRLPRPHRLRCVVGVILPADPAELAAQAGRRSLRGLPGASARVARARAPGTPCIDDAPAPAPQRGVGCARALDARSAHTPTQVLNLIGFVSYAIFNCAECVGRALAPHCPPRPAQRARAHGESRRFLPHAQVLEPQRAGVSPDGFA